MRCLMFAALCALVACGPSSAEIKTAKLANYTGEPPAMFKVVVDTTAETYKIADAGQNGESYALVTQPQWYNPEGGRQSSGAGDYVTIGAGSIRLELLVEMVPTESRRYMITVTPRTLQHLSGSPQPRELKPDDPNLPGWVSGRVDTLQLEIHKRLQNYATK
ncbi:MAG TPA: hypothetical protein VIV11_24575 [Kofleriaceae bacterium]